MPILEELWKPMNLELGEGARMPRTSLLIFDKWSPILFTYDTRCGSEPFVHTTVVIFAVHAIVEVWGHRRVDAER